MRTLPIFFQRRHIFSGAVLFAVLTPFAALAASVGLKTIVPQVGHGCPLGYTAFFAMIQNIITDGVVFAVIVSVLLIAYAGFLFVTNTASPSNVTKGRAVLTSTVIGFVIVLVAWLIVNEFISVLTVGNIASFTSLLHPVSASLCLGISPSKSTATTIPSLKEKSVRTEFAKAGIGVNNPPCPGNASGCTDVGGLQQTTIDQMIIFAKIVGATSCSVGSSSCAIMITGGNEPGHASGTYSHGNGYKVDVRLGLLDALFQSFPSEGTRTGDAPGPAYTDTCNVNSYNKTSSNQYVKESTHWDVRITSLCTATSINSSQ